MREIMFRAWDKIKQKFIIGWEVTGFLSVLRPFERVNMHNIEMMQYIGFQDKNGKAIYEGDILRSFDSQGCEIKTVVRYDEYDCKWNVKKSWVDEFEKEIIGNIFENPDFIDPNDWMNDWIMTRGIAKQND